MIILIQDNIHFFVEKLATFLFNLALSIKLSGSPSTWRNEVRQLLCDCAERPWKGQTGSDDVSLRGTSMNGCSHIRERKKEKMLISVHPEEKFYDGFCSFCYRWPNKQDRFCGYSSARESTFCLFFFFYWRVLFWGT